MRCPRPRIARAALGHGAAACLALALAAVPASPRAEVSGPVVHVSLAGGGELGLDPGEKGGVFEIAAAGGWEVGRWGLRPEVEVALGLAPDSNVALRPGVSWSMPGAPLRLRIALDASNARNRDFGWRWLLLGAAWEVRLTGRLGFDAGVDLGGPISGQAGLPVLLRLGTSLRF